MKGRFIKRIMSAALGTVTAAATIIGTIPMTAFAAGNTYGSVRAELEGEYTLTDSMTYWGESNQKNYQDADGSADGDYLVESMEWTNIKNGEGKIRVAGANTEPSIALYVFTSCFHGVATLSRPKVLAKDIESLANAYDRVDVIAIDGPEEWGELGEGFEGLYGGMHEVKSFTATNAYTAENWVTNEVKRWSGGHFTGNVPAAIRKYMFGAVDAEIDPDNVINRPSAIYVSADLHYLTNAEEAGTYGEESRLAEYATPEMFEYLAKYYRGDTQRYFSSSQTGKEDEEKTVLVKRKSTYDADYMRIVAGVFNPELYSVGDKMLARWSGEAPDSDTTPFPMEDGKFASDYNYKDDMLSAGLRLPDKQISVQKTVSDDFQILGVTAKTTSGLKANISVKGQTITATAASFMSGDEISMEITVKLKNGLSKLYTKASDSGDGAKLLDGDIAIKQTDSAKFMPLTRDVSVSMTWDDDENRDGIRPDGTDIVLSGSEGSSFSYSMKNNEMQVKGLLDYYGGKKVTYSVSEKSISGYTVKVTADSANSSFAVTNTHTPGRTSVKVTKTWEDDENRDGLRPDSIFVTLKGSDGSTYDAELNAKNSWKYEFSNLYSYVDGKEVTYSLTEKSVDGYTTKMTEADGSYTLVNTHVSERMSLSVVHEWVDDENRDGIRPDKVAVTLSGDDGSAYEAVLSKDDGYAYEFENLLVYRDGGKKIKYTLKVESVTGYNQTVSAVSDGYKIVGEHGVSTISYSVVNKWSDDENRDGLRPESLELVLTASNGRNYTAEVSDENGWEAAFNNLPVYTSGGKEITYELLLPDVDGYATVFSKKDKNHDFVIMNTHKPETTSITITKIWDDENDKDGLRKNAAFVLTGSDGSKHECVIKKDAKNPSYTFDNLYVYANGEKISYTLDEKDAAGYEAKFERTEGGYTVTNTHVPGENSKDADDDTDKISIDTPKTGDGNDVFLWLSLAALLAIGGGGAGFYLIRKRGR